MRTTDITSGKIDWTSVPFCKEEPPEKEKYLLKDGDIVISRAGSVGYSHLVKNPRDAVFASYLIRFKPLMDEQYIAYFLKSPSYWNFISEKSLGIAVPNVNASKLKQIMVPLPPLPEQHRIVAKVEELFTRLDAGVEALKKVKAELKRYRQSVLKAAMEGRLTEAWREMHKGEVEPASVLLERIKEERKKKLGKNYKEPAPVDTEDLPELPEGWDWTRIYQVVECLDHMRIPVSRKDCAKRKGDIPYYGANGQVGWIDDSLFDEALVLVVEDETFIGRTMPFCYKITGKSWVNNHAHVLRPLSSVDVDYLNYSLSFYPFTPLTTGTTGRRKLTKRALMSAHYTLPPFDEQKQIVSEVEGRISVIDEVGKTIEQNLNRAARLRQSILKKAFEGKLVPQDPDDEPASVLLERIKAEKARRDADGKAGENVKRGKIKKAVRMRLK